MLKAVRRPQRGNLRFLRKAADKKINIEFYGLSRSCLNLQNTPLKDIHSKIESTSRTYGYNLLYTLKVFILQELCGQVSRGKGRISKEEED